MAVLEVDGVGYSYDRKEVLKKVSFESDSNEIVSVLGPNGVGKTTLLKCICNVLKPSSGSVRICGKEASETGNREMAKLVGYVPQKADVSRTTVFDSVLIGRRPHVGFRYSEEDMDIAWNVIESMGLDEKALEFVDEISGGEFQKVQIARAMAQQPSLLVLDEPSNNLDIANQHVTMRMIEGAVRKRGLCTVMTMHDINLAAAYSDKFVFVKGGRIAAFGGRETITSETIKDVYGINADVITHAGQTVVVPLKERYRSERMSDIHPSIGESKNHEDMIKFWDDYSDQYSGVQQGDIPRRIVDRLFDLKVLRSEDCVLEVGSGPGTYSLEMAPRVRILTCMDSSPRMLKRLSDRAEAIGLKNIELFLKDWTLYQPRKGYDVCIATLCPGSGNPESIERMEGSARRSCALVSWVDNHGDDLNAAIWKELGKDYGYGFRHSTKTEDWLTDNGRNPRVEILTAHIAVDLNLSDLAQKERSAFSAYGVDIDAEGMIRKILGDELDGDVYHYSAENRMKLIVWDSR